MSDRRTRRRRFPVRLRATGLLLTVSVAGCTDSPTAPETRYAPVELTRSWKVVSPASVGVDPDLVADAVARAEATPRFLSLLAVRRGQLFLEEYFGPNGPDSLNDVRSVTKSVVSTLAGIALAEGAIEGLDDPIDRYLEPEIAPLNETQRAITVRHLLTMTSGFAWNESGGTGSYNEWIRSEDHIRALLSLPQVSPPGTSFTYNSGAVHLLGVLVEQATGETLPELADRVLFGPIGIRERRWESLPGGYVNGGAGLDLRPRDLARLGQLFLQDGLSGDRRILPAGWRSEATRPRFSWSFSYGPLRETTYGYLWWVENATPAAYFAWGFGGQFIYVVPSLDLVVVTTTEWHGVTAEGGPEWLEVLALEVILDGVVAAAR